jgi:CBS-domain-containing membrane protein
MTDVHGCTPLEEEDLRAALEEMKTYVDVTEEDLKRIYEIALRHARRRIASAIPVKDVMTKTVVAVNKDADLHEAARLLSDNKISGMPVIDGEQRVIGVISEADILLLAGIKKNHTFRDIVRTLLGETGWTKTTGDNRVQDVMSAPALTVGPGEDIRNAATILDARRIKRLPVVDAERKLIGLISRADIVRTIGKEA